MKCWGDNQYGENGSGNQTPSAAPVDVTGLSSGVVDIDCGINHCCALLANSGVKCWGRNDTGNLGDGTFTLRTTPVDVFGLNSGVIGVSAGGFSGCAVIKGGSVQCWGSNTSGELGDGSFTNRNKPVSISGLPQPVASVSMGQSVACAAARSGNLYCWGANDSGQLGDGTTKPSNVPVLVSGSLSTYYDDFANMQGGIAANQCTTNNKVYSAANFVGWTAATGSVHAHDRSTGDHALALFDTQVATMTTGVAANASGKPYTVKFLASPMITALCNQGTGETDALIVEVLRGDGTTLATYTAKPGAWAGVSKYIPLSFSYTGDGSGPVRLRFSDDAANNKFGGVIDDLGIYAN